MKLLICVVLLLSACKQPRLTEDKNVNIDTISESLKERELQKIDKEINNTSIDSSTTQMPTVLLALTSNALQTINSNTGSSSEIGFGKPIDEMVELINKILEDRVTSIGVNTECGAGPLKMAVWKNGLNLIFKEQKAGGGIWQFVGWYVGKSTYNLKPLQTMAGIGIGSSRAEMEEAYVIKVNKSSLGYEFSTTAGLYGIFDGPNSNAKITDMWSGTTCIFR